MRIGSPSQTQSPQTSRWEVPDMDSDSVKTQQSLLQRLAEMQQAGPNTDKCQNAKNDAEAGTKKSHVHSLIYYNPQDDWFNKIVEELSKSAKPQNQKPESPLANINQDGFEAAAPQSTWKAFSGK